MTRREPIGVLVVDDSAVIRRIVSTLLEADADIRVVGTAGSGRSALEQVARLAPDLITLDIEMPDMDGLETLRQLRARCSRVPVIMFSTATEHAAAATLEALGLGASDYVTKPSDAGGLDAASAAIRAQLIPRIKALVRPARVASSPARVRPVVPGTRRPPDDAGPRTGAHQILAIGASTGGPEAIAEILRQLPGDLPVPVVITQHMPALFTRLFAARLDKGSALTVVEAVADQPLEVGVVVVAPGDHHLVVADDHGRLRVRTNQEPPENWCRPAVDVLFRSVAEVFGARALACVLTGMGHDGRRGCERLRAVGAEIVAQDEETSTVWGMPGAVVKAGLADRIVALQAIPADLAGALNRRRRSVPPRPGPDAGRPW